jgi:hypothetical protein
MKSSAQLLAASLALVILSPALIGCKSLDKPNSESFASVRILGHTPAQIRAATVVVFQQAGFVAARMEGEEMIFEREGSRWDQIAYGSWVEGGSVWVRARVTLVPMTDGYHRLACQAYQVRGKGDPVFEEQVRMKKNRSKDYQDLLVKVVGQLNRLPDGSS